MIILAVGKSLPRRSGVQLLMANWKGGFKGAINKQMGLGLDNNSDMINKGEEP